MKEHQKFSLSFIGMSGLYHNYDAWGHIDMFVIMKLNKPLILFNWLFLQGNGANTLIPFTLSGPSLN